MGFRERLIARLHSWLLPYAAVVGADLAALARSWVLRAWFVLTALVAIYTIMQGSVALPLELPARQVVSAFLSPDMPQKGPARPIAELLEWYLLVWVTFVIILAGGAITSELGVVADSILSRGISRWQYLMGKWTARVVAVLAVYMVVMIPAAAIVWLGGSPASAAMPEVAGAAAESFDSQAAPELLLQSRRIDTKGLAFALAHVALLLALVATCGVAFSATFESTSLAIGVAWVTVYATGLTLSLVGIPYLSPVEFFARLPDLLSGRFVPAVQYWILAISLGTIVSIVTLSGILFARRDV